jgi:hypothetical protein
VVKLDKDTIPTKDTKLVLAGVVPVLPIGKNYVIVVVNLFFLPNHLLFSNWRMAVGAINIVRNE